MVGENKGTNKHKELIQEGDILDATKPNKLHAQGYPLTQSI